MNRPSPLRLLTGTLILASGAVATQTHAVFSMTATNYGAGIEPSGVAAADFDGDGDVDLATTVDGPDRIQILLNDGSGVYSMGPASGLGASSSPQDIVAGDLDNDGDMDVAVAVRDPQGSVVIMANNGAGTFTTLATVTVGERPRGLAIADMDGDKDLDLAVANRDSDTAHVIRNNGGGSFSPIMVATGAEPRATAFADFENDGDLDLAVTNHDGRTIGLFRNDGGSFSSIGTLSVGPFVRPDGITSADLDGDGDDDLAAATSDDARGINQATIYLNTGGAFSGPVSYPTAGQNTSDLIAADFDCDGVLDLAATNQDSNDVSLLPGLGGGVYGAAEIVAVGTTPEGITSADLDGDNDADIATANRDSNDLSVIINDTCTEGIPGDVDGDGIVDFDDLLAVLAAWGVCENCPADLDGNGVVDFDDLLIVLANWS